MTTSTRATTTRIGGGAGVTGKNTKASGLGLVSSRSSVLSSTTDLDKENRLPLILGKDLKNGGSNHSGSSSVVESTKEGSILKKSSLANKSDKIMTSTTNSIVATKPSANQGLLPEVTKDGTKKRTISQVQGLSSNSGALGSGSGSDSSSSTHCSMDTSGRPSKVQKASSQAFSLKNVTAATAADKKTTMLFKRTALGDVTNANPMITTNAAPGMKSSKLSTTTIVKQQPVVVVPSATIKINGDDMDMDMDNESDASVSAMDVSHKSSFNATNRSATSLLSEQIASKLQIVGTRPSTKVAASSSSSLVVVSDKMKKKITTTDSTTITTATNLGLIQAKKPNANIIHPNANNSRDIIKPNTSASSTLMNYSTAPATTTNLAILNPNSVMEVSTQSDHSLDLNDSSCNTSTSSDNCSETDEMIDIDDDFDPNMCSEYVYEILSYLRTKELRKDEKPDPFYLSKQKNLTTDHRSAVINFLSDISLKYNLLSETLLMSVSLLDRFCSRAVVSKSNLQLVALTCLIISSKYEEVCSPFLSDFILISDEAYTRTDLLKMEDIILKILKWNLGYPNALHFLRRYSQANQSDVKVHTMSKYLVELSLCSYEMLKYPGSKIAAAAVWLAKKLIVGNSNSNFGISNSNSNSNSNSGEEDSGKRWNKMMQRHTGYKEEELVECVKVLNKMVGYEGQGVKAVKQKYSDPRLLSVAKCNMIQNL